MLHKYFTLTNMAKFTHQIEGVRLKNLPQWSMRKDSLSFPPSPIISLVVLCFCYE